MRLQDATADQLIQDVELVAPLLMTLDDPTVREKPAERWSVAEVVGHLVDSALNNHQRFIRVQQVDALDFPDYEQNHWANAANYHEADWKELVELWRLVNLNLARVMRAIPDDHLPKSCSIGSHETCTLEFLVTDYVDHMNHHLNKIRERID